MSRKTSVYALMVLTLALILIPGVNAEYPIEDVVVVQDLPDVMIAGSSYEIIITFENVAKKAIYPIVKITVISEPPIIGDDEIFIDEINLNGFDLMYTQESPGVFTTVEGTVAANSHNELSIILYTAVNLMPGAYTFEIDLMGEKIVEPRPRPVINILPVADAGPNRTVDLAQMVEFSGVNSTDPDGYLISWTWDFGDGTEASGVNVSHRYLMGGNYTVTLTVVDVRSGEDTDTCTITVRELVIPTPPLPPFFSNLIITPTELELGDNVTVSFDIMNPNDRTISYGFEMQIEMPIGEQLNLLVDVELEAHELKTVSRTIFPPSVGIYNVTVIGMTGSFTVEAPEIPLEPAEFVLSELEASPVEVEEGEDVTFSVLVQNIGEMAGTCTVEFEVDGETIGTQNVTVAAGSGRRAIVYYEALNAGIFQVSVGDLTETFTVLAPSEPEPEPLKPAEFVFSNLEITPDEDLNIIISVDVTNIGEETGSYSVELKLDGIAIDFEEVTLEGEASITISFELTRGEGTYEVEVEGLTGSFTIELPEEPPFWTSPGYVAGIVIVVTSAGAVIYYIWKSKLFSTISSEST
jgi:PKD repeat protein